jgi:Tol biopolymer transport system component
MNCPNCGTNNPATNKFCRNCGQPLSQTAPPGGVAPMPVGPSQPMVKPARPRSGVPAQLQAATWQQIALPAGIILAMVVAAFFLFALFIWTQNNLAESARMHYSLGLEAVDKRAWDIAVRELHAAGYYLDAPSRLRQAEVQLKALEKLYTSGNEAFGHDGFWDAVYWLRQASAMHPNYLDTNDKLNQAIEKAGPVLLAQSGQWSIADADGESRRDLAGATDRPDVFLSADGQRALAIVPASGDYATVFLLDPATGGHPVPLFSAEFATGRFHPDGRQVLAWGRSGGSWTLTLIEPGEETQPALFESADPIYAAYGADGQRLLIGVKGARGDTLYLADKDGQNRRAIITDAASAWGTFTPDGKRLLLVVREGDTYKLIAANADGSGQRELVTGVDWVAALVAPDGNRLAVRAGKEDKESVLLGTLTGRLNEVVSGVDRSWVEFAPDSSQVLLTLVRGSRASLELRNADGGNPRVLAEGADEVSGRFSTDSRNIAVRVGQGNHWTLSVFGRDGTNPREWVTDAVWAWADFATDDQKLVFSRARGGEDPALFAADLSGGKPIRVTSGVAWWEPLRKQNDQDLLQREHYAAGIRAAQARLWDQAVAEFSQAGEVRDTRVRLTEAQDKMRQVRRFYRQGIEAFDRGLFWDAAYSLRQVTELHAAYKDTETKLREARAKNGRVLLGVQEGGVTWYLAEADGERLERLGLGDRPVVAFAPDGKQMLIRVNQGTRTAVFLTDRDGTNRRDLAPDSSNAWAEFAQDGEHLLLGARLRDGWSVWLTDSEGGNRNELLTQAGDAMGHFNADGSRLVLWEKSVGDQWQVSIANGDGSSKQAVAADLFGVRPELSGDGHWLAVWSQTPEGWNLSLTDLIEGRTQTVEENVQDGWAAFASDSLALFYWLRRDEKWTLIRYSITAGVRYEIVKDVQGAWLWPGPDAQHVVLLAGDRDSFILSVADDQGANPQTLVSDLSNAQVLFSPDGMHLAYWVEQRGTRRLFVANSDGSNPVQLATGADSFTLSWSPDSKKLFLGSTRGGRAQLQAADADGENVVTMSEGAVDIVWPMPGK